MGKKGNLDNGVDLEKVKKEMVESVKNELRREEELVSKITIKNEIDEHSGNGKKYHDDAEEFIRELAVKFDDAYSDKKSYYRHVSILMFRAYILGGALTYECIVKQDSYIITRDEMSKIRGVMADSGLEFKYIESVKSDENDMPNSIYLYFKKEEHINLK